MHCLNCIPKIELIEQESDYDESENLFYQYYICSNCNTRHYCTSQSEDMVEEYLDTCEDEEENE